MTTAAKLTAEQFDVLLTVGNQWERRDYIATRSYGIKAANQLLKMGLIQKEDFAVKYPGSKYDRMLIFFKATEAGQAALLENRA